jgi:hypothetical protein
MLYFRYKPLQIQDSALPPQSRFSRVSMTLRAIALGCYSAFYLRFSAYAYSIYCTAWI